MTSMAKISQINSYGITTRGLTTALSVAAICLVLILSSPVFTQRNASSARLKAAAAKELERANTLYKENNFNSVNAALEGFQQARELYRQAGLRRDEADALTMIAHTYWKLGNPESTFASLDEAYRVSTQIKDTYGRAGALNNIASYKRDVGALEESLANYEQALPLMRAAKNKTGEARVLNGIGEIHRYRGNNREAVTFLSQSIAIWQTVEMNDDRIRAIRNLSLAHYASGNLEQSVKFANESLRFARTRNEPGLEVDVLESLAQIYDTDGKLDVSVDYRLKALKVYETAGNRIPEQALDLVTNNLADVYYRKGELNTALQYATRRFRPNAKAEDYATQSYLAGTICEILSTQGEYSKAIDACRKGITLARGAEDKHSEAYNFASLGIAYLGMQNLNSAEEAFNTALGFYARGENRTVEGKAMGGLIVVKAFNRDSDKTESLIRDAKSRKLDEGTDIPAIMTNRAFGIANALFGQNADAISYLEKALSIARSRGNVVEQVGTSENLGYSNLQSGNFEKALAFYRVSTEGSRAFGNKPNEANSLVQEGWVLLQLKRPDEAIVAADKALATVKVVNDEGFRRYISVNAFHVKGKSFFAKGDYKSSLAAINESLSFAEKLRDKESQKHFLNDLAEIYEAMGDNKQAKNYKKKADQID